MSQVLPIGCVLALLLTLTLEGCGTASNNEDTGTPTGPNPPDPSPPSSPPPPGTDNAPRFDQLDLVYLASSQTARLTVHASDPDGTPTAITCEGDLAGSQPDILEVSLTIRQGTEPRPIFSKCTVTSAGKMVGPEMAITTIPAAGSSTYVDELARLINQYRAQRGLPAIPVSKSLGYVALTHATDLAINRPDAPSQCNAHSWSNRGPWSACCYTPDHKQARCMWDKPRELTLYTGNGYENAAFTTASRISPTQALEAWKGSPAHHDVILNRGTWADNTWRAIGGGLHSRYAVVWFGEVQDPVD